MKLAGFVLMLVAAFGGGTLLGSAVGPEPPDAPATTVTVPHDDSGADDHGTGHP